ncbi:hypothetical protein [Pseudanabaena minima]|uniref:hypothetical protein n=1 Tax=Pseudanabaena minima TaxID=890415 RepID=UPI003DA7D247
MIKCDRPIIQFTKQRSPIHQKQNNAIAPPIKLQNSDRLSIPINSDRPSKKSTKQRSPIHLHKHRSLPDEVLYLIVSISFF